jgi:hypothetical protein
VRKRQTVTGVVIRLCLIAAAVWWWSLLLNICSNVPQPNLASRRTIPLNCPVSGLAFITPTQRNLLYGLVPVCLMLTIADFLIRKRRDNRDR